MRLTQLVALRSQKTEQDSLMRSEFLEREKVIALDKAIGLVGLGYHFVQVRPIFLIDGNEFRVNLYKFNDEWQTVVAAESLEQATEYLRNEWSEGDRELFDEQGIKGEEVNYYDDLYVTDIGNTTYADFLSLIMDQHAEQIPPLNLVIPSDAGDDLELSNKLVLPTTLCWYHEPRKKGDN
jgi:hypothetical protein